MKMKTINLDGEKWIKKSHYDKLHKQKNKVEKKKFNFKEVCCTGPSNIIAVFPLDNFRFGNKIVIPHESGTMEFKEFDGVVKTKHYSLEAGAPIMDLDGNFYNYDYVIKAKEIARALGNTKEFKTYIVSWGTQKPILLDFINFGVLIAPREYNDE